MRALLLLTCVLTACSPAAIATDLTRRTAKTVVLPVVSATTPAPAADLATECILANASNVELNALARDVGVQAGTTTVEHVRIIAARPATRDCIAGKGLAPLVI